MQVVRFSDAPSFLRRAESFLLGAEAENNLMLSVADMARAFGDDSYLAVVTDGDAVVACALRTPPYKAVMTRAPRPAIECLAADLALRYPTLSQVFGPDPDVAYFAEVWARRTGVASTQGMRQRMFEIRKPPKLGERVSGTLRLAEERDMPLLVAWSVAFVAETLPGEPLDPEKHAASRIASRSLYLWEDGQPVSMAGWAGRTAHGVRVNFVYTPPEHRRCGYATACVARLTQHLLAEGRTFCCLYTDLSNPTSNSIYLKIGYRPICDLSTFVLNP